MAKFIKIENTFGQYMFDCPGCNTHHCVWTDNRDNVTTWSFNGDVEKPTVSPSILVKYPANPNAIEQFKQWRTERICHSFITDGKIQFLSDCTHHLAGKTVDLNDI